MENYITLSLVASLVMTLLALLIVPFKIWWNRKFLSRGGIGAVLATSGFLFLSILFLRFAELHFATVTGQSYAENISSIGEKLVSSFLASLRTFSMEEKYSDFIPQLRTMITTLFPHQPFWDHFFVFYTSALNLVAPIAGGAIILEILASVFPKLKLLWARYLSNREKVYFSELNPESLAMAKSVSDYYSKELKQRRPILIFTDVYIDDESEKEYELLMEAKHIGAICVRDDLAHVDKLGLGKRNFFLMDVNEFGNLQTLVAMSEDRNAPYARNSNIYIFVQSDAYIRVEQQVKDKLKAYAQKKKRYIRKTKRIQSALDKLGAPMVQEPVTEEEKALAAKIDVLKDKKKILDNKITQSLPGIVPVFGFRNLVLNLFSDVPLYEPLIRRENKKDLHIAILGSGIIGTEAFLNAYWLGQMMFENKAGTMDPCNLHIHILSKESGTDFLAKLDYICPEIRDSIRFEITPKPNARPEDPREAFVSDPKIDPPYASVKYTETDIKIGSFWDDDQADCRQMLNSDYLIVALGNDLDNLSVAEKLRVFIGQKHLEKTKETDTVIAYAIFHSELCQTLNRKNPDSKAELPGVYMHAFGSLEQVYSTDNVFLSKAKALAEEMGEAYIKHKNTYLTEHAKRSNNEDQNFTFWANIARVKHTKYKLFSLGMITCSLFDSKKTELADHTKQIQALNNQYHRVATLPEDALTPEDHRIYEDLERKKHSLAWLEHRRWCAFTRTMGYRSTDALKSNLYTAGSHKNMPLKLHPCLVEARLHTDSRGEISYIHGEFDERGKLTEASELAWSREDMDNAPDLYDPLDRLSHRWNAVWNENREYIKKKNLSVESYDFKKYDYYRYEYGDCIPARDFLKWNQSAYLPHLTGEKLLSLCKKKEIQGAQEYPQKGWIIPVAYFHQELEKRYRKVTKGKEPTLLKACKDGKIPKAFAFESVWFVPKSQESIEPKKIAPAQSSTPK